ncbi:MAG TPA: CBS domain-containing protein [Ktedonobacteraceae bacterium]|nr:CBS domain-containing protein [Ktedonobacteraceae bacterium]
MIVRDIMITGLITVAPDDTLAHAAGLLRQHQFHHLPVARKIYVREPSSEDSTPQKRKEVLLCEGILTSQDIDMAAALAAQNNQQRSWQEQRVVEVMHRETIRVTPSTSVAAAAQILVERGLSSLLVVEYSQIDHESRSVLVGLLTRSDLLIALSRALGAFEPGMQLDIALPLGNVAPLARTLQLADELHMRIRSIMAAPRESGIPDVATIRLGTINPTPLLIRLQGEGIQYAFGAPLLEGDAHV